MGLSDPPMTMLYDAEDDEGDPVGFCPILSNPWLVSASASPTPPPVVSGYGFCPILTSPWLVSAAPASPPPAPAGYGFDPVLSNPWLITALAGSTPPPPTPTGVSFDPIFNPWWVNGGYVYVPPIILPGDFYEALHAHLVSTLTVPGGIFFGRLPTTHDIWPAISYWQISSTEERVWDGGPVEAIRIQFTIAATNDSGVRSVGRALKDAMYAIRQPNRLLFEGGEAARADMVIDLINTSEQRLPGTKPLWTRMMDYMFEVQYESE